MAEHKTDAATWQKFRWAAEYHNAAVTTLMGESKASRYSISDGTGIARTFSLVKQLEPTPN